MSKFLTMSFNDVSAWFKTLDRLTQFWTILLVVIVFLMYSAAVAVASFYAFGYIFNHIDAAIFLVVLYFVIRLATRPR